MIRICQKCEAWFESTKDEEKMLRYCPCGSGMVLDQVNSVEDLGLRESRRIVDMDDVRTVKI